MAATREAYVDSECKWKQQKARNSMIIFRDARGLQSAHM